MGRHSSGELPEFSGNCRNFLGIYRNFLGIYRTDSEYSYFLNGTVSVGSQETVGVLRKPPEFSAAKFHVREVTDFLGFSG